jgi:hypothetical protein
MINKQINIFSTGNYYRNEKTENAAIFDNQIFGEMDDIENIHFVQLRIDKSITQEYQIGKLGRNTDKALITIVLQTVDLKQLMIFQLPIDENVFDKLYFQKTSVAIDGEELENKVIALSRIDSNLIDKGTVSISMESNDLLSGSMDNSNQTKAATYNGWRVLINDLNSNGHAKLSNYAGIDRSIIQGNGWHHFAGWNPGYGFSAYTTTSSATIKYVQFSLFDIIYQGYSYGANTNKWVTNLRLSIYGGLSCLYFTETDELYVYYYNKGLHLADVELGINDLSNYAVYINRYVDGLYSTRPNYILAALSIIPPMQSVASWYDYLGANSNQTCGQTITYDQTYATQYNRYSGSVIRGISATTHGTLMDKAGQYIFVQGLISLTNGSSQWKYGWRCSCYY